MDKLIVSGKRDAVMQHVIPSSETIKSTMLSRASARLSPLKVIGGAVLVLAFALTSQAQDHSSRHFRDAASQSSKASRVFREIMRTPDKGIPRGILNGAECVAVFPSVIKAGFVVGGRGGRGVASCRTERGWSAPAFFDLKGGSFGLQIGAQSTDFVLLFMNTRGLERLIGDKFEIGGDASVAAGPVGRQAGASTNIRLDAEILSYSRSRGLFAGLELKGVVISQDKDDIRAVYGDDADARAVIRDSKFTAPAEVRVFPTTLTHYSPHK